jgi:hypothetical protein
VSRQNAPTPEWIHDVGVHDGRGRRHFLVDGKRIDAVFFADLRKGYVDRYRKPTKVHRHKKRAIWERVRGKVEVVYEDDQ